MRPNSGPWNPRASTTSTRTIHSLRNRSHCNTDRVQTISLSAADINRLLDRPPLQEELNRLIALPTNWVKMATGTGEKKCRYNKARYRPGVGNEGIIFVNRVLGVPVPVDVSPVQMLEYGLEMQRG